MLSAYWFAARNPSMFLAWIECVCAVISSRTQDRPCQPECEERCN